MYHLKSNYFPKGKSVTFPETAQKGNSVTFSVTEGLVVCYFACFCSNYLNFRLLNNVLKLILNFVFYSYSDSAFLFFSFLFCFLQFYLEEAKGRVDYQGYIFPRRRGNTVSALPLICHSFFVKQVLEIRNGPLLNALLDDRLEVVLNLIE